MMIVDYELTTILNYAMAYFKMPIIKKIRIRQNYRNGDGHIYIHISCEPNFLLRNKDSVISLENEGEVSIENITPDYNLDYLYNFREEEIQAKICIDVYKDKKLAKKIHNLITLVNRRNYWGHIHPQLIAAYINPYDSYLSKIIEETKNLFFSQYIQNQEVPKIMSRDYIIKIIRCLYKSISQCNIAFAYPTKSLSHPGQKILSTKEIIQNKKGCCLDMAILFCSCLESLGLKPLLILHENHAYAGCWINSNLPDFTFSKLPSLIIKKSICSKPQIILVETTYLIYRLKRTCPEHIPFEQSLNKAIKNILDINSFVYAVDILGACEAGITPLCI